MEKMLLDHDENLTDSLVWAMFKEGDDRSMKLNRHFLSLTKRQKEALFLRYYENRSNDEIAEIMEINKQSVSNLLLKSLAILRENWVHTLILLFFN